MKKYRYTVKYKNDNEESFICNGYVEAIIKAIAFAYDKAWDSSIESVTDEKGNVITDIEINIKYK